jgi:hypothetical protein
MQQVGATGREEEESLHSVILAIRHIDIRHRHRHID